VAPAGAQRRQALELAERVVERDLAVRVLLDDPRQPRRGGVLAVHRARPPHRVDGRFAAGVGAHQVAGERSRPLQALVLVRRLGRLVQPPVRVQPWLDLARAGIGPRAAARHDHRRRAEDAAQDVHARRGALVQLHRQDQPLAQALLVRLVAGKGRDRRANDHRAPLLGRVLGQADRA
jgi:hypothetical protein